jgi:hypothetical protein
MFFLLLLFNDREGSGSQTNKSGSATLVCRYIVQVYRIRVLDSEPNTIAVKTDNISFLYNPFSNQCCRSGSRISGEFGSG